MALLFSFGWFSKAPISFQQVLSICRAENPFACVQHRQQLSEPHQVRKVGPVKYRDWYNYFMCILHMEYFHLAYQELWRILQSIALLPIQNKQRFTSCSLILRYCSTLSGKAGQRTFCVCFLLILLNQSTVPLRRDINKQTSKLMPSEAIKENVSPMFWCIFHSKHRVVPTKLQIIWIF